MSTIDNLQAILARGQDRPLLRYGLGLEYWKARDPQEAIAHLTLALDHNPNHSASWKLCGRALVDAGRRAGALAAFAQGIRIAERKGDLQAAKEMRVFHCRVEKRSTPRLAVRGCQGSTLSREGTLVAHDHIRTPIALVVPAPDWTFQDRPFDGPEPIQPDPAPARADQREQQGILQL